MTISYDRLGEQLLVAKATGPVDEKELFEHRRRLVEDRAFGSGFDFLFDLSEADLTPLDADAIRRLAERETRTPIHPARRIALLVGSEVNEGLVQVYRLLSEHYVVRIRVFRSLAVAEAWLLEEVDDEEIA